MPRKTQLNVVSSDPDQDVAATAHAQDEDVPVYTIDLLIEHYPALNRWMTDKSDDNLVDLFEVVYPGAKKLPLAQFVPMLQAFGIAMNAYYEQTKGGK